MSRFEKYNKSRSIWTMLKNRNFSQLAKVQTQGGRIQLKQHNFIVEDLLYYFNYAKEYLRYILFKQISIPQIEFEVTTRCTLRCKNCTNYIPYLKSDQHKVIEIDEFKSYIKNLTKVVYKIEDFVLLGGEALLVKNLNEYLEYAAKNRKIKRVWLITNGTIEMPEPLIDVIKKYRKKVIVWISNYSANEEIKSKLKHEKIIEQIKPTGAKLFCNEDINWSYVSHNFSSRNRTNIENIRYFKQCGISCVTVLGNNIYVCPRAGMFHLMNLYEPSKSEVVDLAKVSGRKLKDALISFYEKSYFGACNFCNYNEDRILERTIPAIQIQGEGNDID